MPAERRVVRVSPAFFDQLDQQLESDRGDAGEPSVTDFLVIYLPPIVERFATDFEELSEVVEGVVPAARFSSLQGASPATAPPSTTTQPRDTPHFTALQASRTLGAEAPDVARLLAACDPTSVRLDEGVSTTVVLCFSAHGQCRSTPTQRV